jgi:acyl-[acyl-carrier-protein]-phospholipid O-acyltransferase / long-chain-fatty-acid--[acyl-carrier-protein] ligase
MAKPASQLSLLTKRRFAPLFVTNLLDVFNDNMFKTALLILASYGLYRAHPDRAAMLATVATGLFILPFFLFSAMAGQVADAWDRSHLVRMVKVAEVAIMALGLVGFHAQSVPLLLTALFLMGVHSAFYGPLKYAILPQQLGKDEILGATGMMEAGGFVAILAGQLVAGVIAPWQAGLLACVLAGVGLCASLAIPPARPVQGGGRIELNVAVESWRLVRMAMAVRPVWLSVLAIAWFYAVGAVLLGELIPLVKGMLHARQAVAVLFLSIFSIGVALGALLVNRLLRGEVSGRYVPVSALLLSVALIDLSFSVGGFHGQGRDIGLAAFAVLPGAWRIILDLAAISVCGGVFVIPLYAILQTHSPAEQRSRILAGNNIVNAGITVAAIAMAAGLLKLGVGIAGLIALLGTATLVVALAACALLPETVIKAVVRAVLKRLYRVELIGGEHMPRPGEGAVVVVNHVSYLDGLLLAAFLPGRPTFAVHTRIAQAWWMKPVLPFFDAFPVDTTNPMSAKAMVLAVREGRTLVVFPEGRITVTGALMKVFAGPGMVADKAGAPIIPVRIDGAQYTRFSHLKGKVRLRGFPKIRLTVLPPRRFDLDGVESARRRRALSADRLYDVMSEMMFATSDTDCTLFQALLDARAVHGGKAAAIEDVKRQALSYDRLVVGARALGGVLKRGTVVGEAVGVMLPNVNPAVATFFALQSTGRVPAMLNYSAGPAHLEAACDTTEIQTIITARAFVAQARLEGGVTRLEASGRRILWLEDLAREISPAAKLAALLADRFSGLFAALVPRRGQAVDAPAVILFTSGSEGAPKGVALSHRNLLANCAQIAARVDFNPTDRVLNALPIFHSFGLTGGLLLPLLNGVRTLLYPNPLHYGTIPAFAYDANATILFGSDTFLSGYARMAQSYDFYSLRYIFAGAERVKPETRAAFADKFGLRILEGYGATECAPVIAVNTPMHFRPGSVGRLLPGIEARLETVPGIEAGGKLFVRGPNVMAGYYLVAMPGVLQPPPGGWHDTGDIVSLDAEGFVTICGRVKRFAKIGGEMVSLGAVEDQTASAWPEAAHAAVARPDPRKGEELVLFTTQPGATAAALLAWGRARGVAELALPRDVRVVEAIPTLATGKADYVTLNALAMASRLETA